MKFEYRHGLVPLNQQPEIPDTRTVRGLDLSVLDMETFHAFRDCLTDPPKSYLSRDMDDETFLGRIRAVHRDRESGATRPTVAGLLMFGKIDRIRFVFPQYRLVYQDGHESICSDSRDWSGNLFNFFTRVCPKLLYGLEPGTPVYHSLREALVNSIVHADFFESGGIVIQKTPGQIVIENPGYIYIGKKRMLQGHDSYPRNTALMDMFVKLNLAFWAGCGVPELLTAWESAGWQAPVYEEQIYPTRTILTLSFVPKEQSQPALPEPDWVERNTAYKHRIVQYLRMVHAVSPSSIADYIGLNISQTRAILRELRRDGFVQAEGINTSRRYFLTPDEQP